jgi:phospholipase A1/A2
MKSLLVKNQLLILSLLGSTLTCAQVSAQVSPSLSPSPLHCPTITDHVARLACYDSWAQQVQRPAPSATSAASTTSSVASSPAAITATTATATTTTPPPPTLAAQTTEQRVALQPSEITRFWDLEKATEKETFQLRGYRPVSLAVSAADRVSILPNSPTNGSPAAPVAFSASEMKINLSVRTKIATGLLHRSDHPLNDSLWFGYSQQSYWQLFNGGISRPFRATDHEPELMYVFGHALPLPGGWVYRMSGAGVVHQSNGQSLPLSRSWNRAYVMAAADKITAGGHHRFTLQAKAWQRLREDPAKDDNPDISNLVGRAEIAGRWSFDTGPEKDLTTHTLGLTVRHSLRKQARGSMRLEYLRSLGSANSGLRFHTQLFSGYGDSLIDYNRRRTTFSLGLSLVDW